MTRNQILRPLKEDFTAEELQIINANEKVLRRSISKILSSVGDSTIISGTTETPDVVEETATTIAKKIWPEKKEQELEKGKKKKSPYESRIYQKIQSAIANLLASPKYVADCSVILNDLQKPNSLASLISEKKFELSKAFGDYTDKTKNFLMDLYDIKLSFGGGNTIGAGELCFAAMFSDTVLCNHTDNNNKYDLLLSKNGETIGIEIKADGGRLDGSGMKAYSVKIEGLFTALKTAIKDNLGIPRPNGENDEAVKAFEGLVELLKPRSGNCIERNPFSRQSIKTFWLGELPRALAIIGQGDDKAITETLEDFLNSIYNGLVYDGLGVNDAYLQDDIENMANICKSYCNSNPETIPNTNDVESFVMDDTMIRSHTYMGLYRNEEATGRGYLLFTKATGNNVLCKVIDYTGVLKTAEDDWTHGEFKITPGNDDRRAAPIIYVKDAPASVTERRRRLRSRGLRESYISRHR